jgi:hypothetical protein
VSGPITERPVARDAVAMGFGANVRDEIETKQAKSDNTEFRNGGWRLTCRFIPAAH